MYRQPHYTGYNGNTIRNGQYGSYGQMRPTPTSVEPSPTVETPIEVEKPYNETSMKTISLHLSSELASQLSTVFVYKLPRNLSEASLAKIWALLPGFKSWFRLKTAHGQNTTFGFLQFDSVIGVANGLKVLESVDTLGLAKVEDNTVKWIEMSHVNIEENTALVAQIKELIQRESSNEITQEDEESMETIDNEPENINDSMAMNAEELASIAPESKDLIMNEILEFRIQSTKFEKNRQLAEREEEKKRQLKSTEATRKALTEPSNDNEKLQINNSYARDNSNVNGNENENVNDNDNDKEDEKDDWTIEKIRQDSIDARLEFEFQDRQARWMNRERIHKSALDRDEKRKQSDKLHRAEERQLALDRFEKFVDGGSYERDHFEYYYDHASWAKSRLAYREREIEADDRDKEMEGDINMEEPVQKEEFLADQFLHKIGTGIKLSLSDKAKTTTTTATTTATTATTTPTTTTTAPPTKIFEDEEPTKPRAMFLPRPITEEEPTSLDTLETSIPQDGPSLLDYPIAWDQLDDTIIDTHLRPVIEAKIIEYIGIKEDDLIEFVVEYLRGPGHRDPRELLAEMEMTLDEDAESFTVAVWRVLALQLEKKRLGV